MTDFTTLAPAPLIDLTVARLARLIPTQRQRNRAILTRMLDDYLDGKIAIAWEDGNPRGLPIDDAAKMMSSA